MPYWKIHLKTGLEVSKKIKTNNLDTFLVSNVAPDIKSGYVLQNIKETINTYQSHYYGNDGQNMPNMEEFYINYRDIFNTDVGLGYACHLLTDYYWNKQINEKLIYDNNSVIGIKTINENIFDNRKNCVRIKQLDFKMFTKNVLFDYKIDESKLSNYDKQIFDEFYINEEEINSAIQFINKNCYKTQELNDETIIFTKEEYQNIYLDCIDFVVKELNKLRKREF